MDDDMANLLVAQLLYLDSADKKRDITMYVNSPGGSVTAGEIGQGHCIMPFHEPFKPLSQAPGSLEGTAVLISKWARKA